MCSIFCCLIGNYSLKYSVILNLILNISCLDTCWSSCVVALEWYTCCMLKHNWSVHVEFGNWGIMTFGIGGLFNLDFSPE